MKRISVFLLFASCVLAQGGHSVTIAITDGQNVGASYAVYRLTGACPSQAPTATPPPGWLLLNATGITALTYTDTTVAAGGSYCYNVIAITSAGSSAPSNDAGASVPGSFPVQITVSAK